MPWKLRILSYEFYVGPYLAFAVVTRAVVSCRFVKLCSIGYYAILFLNCKSQTKSLKVVVLIEDKISLRYKFVKNSAIPGLFFFNFVFSIQLIVHINFADGWIQTADLWFRKRPLYQLCHNHFPSNDFAHDISLALIGAGSISSAIDAQQIVLYAK